MHLKMLYNSQKYYTKYDNKMQHKDLIEFAILVE